MTSDTKNSFNLLLQFVLVMASIVGSLIFSEVMKFAPCDLCWYQRLCIYPMGLIILTGLYLQSRETVYYLTPFALAGLGFSIYHNLVYYKVVEVIVPCSESAPCTQQHINWFGFITIPMLAFFSFIALTILNFVAIYQSRKNRV